MKALIRSCLIAASSFAATAGAGDFDGSRTLICAPTEVMDCVSALPECWSGSPQRAGAPTFLRIDFKKKAVIGPMKTSAIKHMESNDRQIILLGTEHDMGWTVALDKETGDVSITLADRVGAFVMFGSCTVP